MKKFLFVFSFILVIVPDPIHPECVKGECGSGTGVFVYPNGAKYAGEWKNGKKDGSGSYVWPEGTLYTGEFRDDRPHGKGRIASADGTEKFVIFESGKVTVSRRLKPEPFRDEAAFGEYSHRGQYRGWHKGNKFSGYRPHGRGSMTWEDGAKYSGQWRNGKMHGRGRMRWPDGSSYEGEWKMGVRSGYGTYIWPGGTCYSGQWKDNKRHGVGKQVNDDGKIFDGLWENGNFVNNASI